MIATVLAAQFYDSVKNLHPDGSDWDKNLELQKVFAAMKSDGFKSIGHCRGHFFGRYGNVFRVVDVHGFGHKTTDFIRGTDMANFVMTL